MGRPKGAKTEKLIAPAAPSRCPKCHSTNRAPYHDVNTLEHGGLDAAGQPYNRVVFRRTACTDCGQARVDRAYEYDAPDEDE